MCGFFPYKYTIKIDNKEYPLTINATDTEPGDIKWENLHVSFLERLWGRFKFGFIVFCCIFLCFIIITVMESFLNTLEAPENCYEKLNT